MLNPLMPNIARQLIPKNNLRLDGTKKGRGWLGPIETIDGRTMTELSIGVNFGGKNYLIPSLVPTLSQKDIEHLRIGGKPTESIIKKAINHAIKRLDAGKSPFK